MSYKHRWRVHVTNLETTIGVGIYERELAAQRVLVNAVVEGHYPAMPKVISDCYNYEHIHKLVAQEWPKAPHRPLLEQCVVELLAYIFRSDPRVDFARVSISKPDVFAAAESVGVETQWTRADFEQFTN